MPDFSEKLEFECWKTGETYMSHGKWYNDGPGYWDVKSKKDCPHCGDRHWQ